MKIELNENKVYFNNGSIKKEIHPFWLRERVNGEEFLDKGTQQRLFDPTTLNNNISISKVDIIDKFLEINFDDGVKSKLEIDKLVLEFSNIDTVIKAIQKRQDLIVASIEFIAYYLDYIDLTQLHKLALKYNNSYGEYLLKIKN